MSELISAAADISVLSSQADQKLKSGQPVNLSHLPRAERLKVINQILDSNSLRALEGIGDSSQGQIEFVGINAITPDPVKPGAFVTRVDFQCNKPQPEGFNHLSFFNAGATMHSGVVILPVVNDQYILMIQQFRPVIGRSTIEIPRGFAADLGDPNQIKSYGAALIELAQETGVDLRKTDHKVTKEFSLYENTGTSNILNAVLVINLKLSEDQLKQIHSRIINDSDEIGQSIKTLLVPVSEVKGITQDNHTAAALFKGL